jgi:hypothetical protein
MQSGFWAGHGWTSATLKVLNDIITAIDKRQYCAAVVIDLAKAFDYVITAFLSADSIALASQMTASPGLPTTYQTEICVKSGGPVVQTFGSLYGGATGLNSRVYSFLCIYQWCCSCFWWFSDPPLRRRHNSVYIWPFFGHCANKPPKQASTPYNTPSVACSSTDCCPHPRPTSITTLDGSDLEYVDNYKYLV